MWQGAGQKRVPEEGGREGCEGSGYHEKNHFRSRRSGPDKKGDEIDGNTS